VLIAPVHHDWPEMDALYASVEGWDVFPGIAANKQRPFTLERRYDIGAFASDQLAWRHVWKRAEAGSALHTRALAFLKKHSPIEHEEIRKHCLGLEVKHDRFHPKEER
jgi:hypothetical protein